ncbi:MAG: hypothetical protein PHU86_04195 [Patescibacteria group bacterium]|nr:hypothetical protein [Patescibacteria group bacterium]
MKPKEPVVLLQENRALLNEHHVKSLYLFGFVVREEEAVRAA